MIKFSVIIAVYNEADNIRLCIENVRGLENNVEIIVVDGHSQDGSYELSRSLGVNTYRSFKGRGSQFNEGAKNATGDILIFLHVDTKLPSDVFTQLQNTFDDQKVKIGTFRMRFDSGRWILRFYAFFTRFDSILTSFGDQGIVVRKDFFDSIGGFPEWPLFEDVHFLRLARKHTKIYSLPGSVVTSARKFLKKGIVRQQLFNSFLILKYLAGVSPQKLYEEYYGETHS